jgi:FkbM family methyltransferase
MFQELRSLLRDKRKRRHLIRNASRTPFGFKFSGNEAMALGEFEPLETSLLRRELQTTDCFVDVGANIGYYSMHALSLGRPVFVFEPSRDNLEVLYYNLGLNDWNECEIFAMGLDATPRLVAFYGDGTGASMIDGWGGGNSLLHSTIPTNTLDNMIGHRLLGRRALVKIDVEGSEHAVLLGASSVLNLQPAPAWIVEICFDENFPRRVNEKYGQTFEIFFKNGYRAFSIETAEREICAEDVSRWLGSGVRDQGIGHNFIFRK